MGASFYTPFQPTLTNRGQGLFGLDVSLHAAQDLRLSSTVFAFVQVKVDLPTVYPIVPDGTNIVFFSHCRQSFGGTQQAILEVPLTLEKGDYFGIWFYPGAIRRLFDVDIAEVTNQIAGLDYLVEHAMDSEWLSLGERLYEQTSVGERILLCEKLLLQRLVEQTIPVKFAVALQAIYRSYGQCSAQSLCELSGWSQRHLNRQFQLHTGLSVKAFAQTIRINEYLKRCYQTVQKPLHHGLDLGFYDHSHLLKTLKQHELSGLSSRAKDVMSSFYNPSY